ncbi:hypothetical protein Fot_19197 [Forsythia ovata]|uniref:TOD1/MUCI70 glycosyltransferase-like domain-containing protein n=1 Tax=Forsythia ovata TaxID=205694 RepID=A0ABD1VKC1_9LAMI
MEVNNHELKEVSYFELREAWLSKLQVHCGFMQGGGAEMTTKDIKYVMKCRFVVVSGIFYGYDTPHQPSNISKRSERLFCFLMVVDEVSLDFIKNNVTVREDDDGGQWVDIYGAGSTPLPLHSINITAVCSIYEEADANKRRKRYARPLIDLHVKIYRFEGMEPWNPNKGTLMSMLSSHLTSSAKTATDQHETSDTSYTTAVLQKKKTDE